VSTLPGMRELEEPLDWREHLELEAGDISLCDTEAIVNAASTDLWMGGGVAGVLKRAGGNSIEREAVAQAPISIGDSVLTGGGELPCLYVIHAAAMAPGRPATAEGVYAATLSALRMAEQAEIDSVAFPALGTGVGGLSFADCARAMYQALVTHYSESDTPDELRLVLFGENALAVFKAELEAWGK
jgi:O-acetyl-ADP-ribose deacetylase (regulator of RNase III)